MWLSLYIWAMQGSHGMVVNCTAAIFLSVDFLYVRGRNSFLTRELG